MELGCSDSFTPLKPRSRKKGRLRLGLGLRHLRDELTTTKWWSLMIREELELLTMERFRESSCRDRRERERSVLE